MASAALIAPAVWHLLFAVDAATGASTVASVQSAAGVTIALTIVIGAIVVPSAFAFGTLLWGRYVPDEQSLLRGLLCGGATAYGCLLAVSMVIAGTVVGLGAVGGGASVLGVVAGFLVLWVIATILATILAGWIVVPLGAAAGAYHELARTNPADATVDG